MIKNNFSFVCGVLLGLAGWLATSARAETPTLYATMIANSHLQCMASKVMGRVYGNLGMRMEVLPMPAKRALAYSSSGQADAELLRLEGFSKQYPDLLPVPEPYLGFSGVAFSGPVVGTISGWKDLRAYRVGVVRGVRYSNEGTEGMERILANDLPQLFDLLEKGRVSVVVTSRVSGSVEVARRGLTPSIVVNGQPLYERPLYHYVHRDHAALIPLLDAEIRRMKASGELQAITDQALDELLLNAQTGGLSECTQ
ncbi:substrate-binding periplasmic protein [Aestuariirhabdus sp. LZHN29]|uniref:substrate-binding periplasmic protein n=1 Tax=Aestuariirhabdus sp. LZHN29 TaxID=3417462 RepID=UPI003CF09491